jgi:hypothetical protein
MAGIIWLLPATVSLVLIASLVYLGSKSKGHNRQLEKFNRRISRFLETLPKPKAIENHAELPTIPAAKANRRVVVDARTKKREVRQRRLVEHLKDLQAKESE